MSKGLLLTNARGEYKIRLRDGTHIMRHVYFLSIGAKTIPCCRYTKPNMLPGWIVLEPLNVYSDSSRQPGSEYITSYGEAKETHQQALAEAAKDIGKGLRLEPLDCPPEVIGGPIEGSVK